MHSLHIRWKVQHKQFELKTLALKTQIQVKDRRTYYFSLKFLYEEACISTGPRLAGGENFQSFYANIATNRYA